MRLWVFLGLCAVLVFGQSCDDAGGLETGSGNTFEAVSADSMSIDDIVTDASYPVVAPVSASSFFPFHLMVGATAEYYHGRFIYNDGGAITVGRMSFKIVKNSASTGYFADWTVHRIVNITDPLTWSATLTADSAEPVPAGHDGDENHIGIRNEFKRHITFSVNFTSNNHFADIDRGSAIVSEDYKTIVGGDGGRMNFIATRQTVTPSSIDNADLLNNWGAYNMYPNGTGNIDTGGLTTDSYGGTSVDPEHGTVVDFSGRNGDGVDFVGEAKLIDSDIGIFIYAEDDFGINLSSVDGVILIAPNKGLMMRFDLNTDLDIFACDKFSK